MKSRLNKEAFTIVETLIVLAVTGTLLLVAMIMIAGQQRKTEFYQAVREIESKLQDFANDTATGFYPKNANFSCSADGATDPVINYSASQALGKNADCVYLGRAIQLSPSDGNNRDILAYTVVGSRVYNTSAGKVLSTNPNQSRPTALANPSNLTSHAEIDSLKYGLQARKMTIGPITGTSQISGVGFIAINPVSGSTSDGQNVGTFAVDLVPMSGALGTSNKQAFVDAINAINNSTAVNPATGVELCLQGGTNQYAIIKIGGSGSKIDINTTINGGNCPS